MFYLKKTMEISAAHKLELNYDSKCQRIHGHNFQVTIYCKTRELNKNGMVIDFHDIKEVIEDEIDHQNLNDITKLGNPTSENLAFFIYDKISNCYKVTVKESGGNEVTYEYEEGDII